MRKSTESRLAEVELQMQLPTTNTKVVEIHFPASDQSDLLGGI